METKRYDLTENVYMFEQMNTKIEKLISELELYFSLYPVEQEKSAAFISTLSSVENTLKPIAGNFFAESASPSSQEGMILDIIRHCDDATQEELIHNFGEESIVAQVIRQNRIEKNINAKKPHYPYNILKENLKQEIKDIKKKQVEIRSINPYVIIWRDLDFIKILIFIIPLVCQDSSLRACVMQEIRSVKRLFFGLLWA